MAHPPIDEPAIPNDGAVIPDDEPVLPLGEVAESLYKLQIARQKQAMAVY